MKYIMTDNFSKEKYDEEEDTKEIILINLTQINSGYSKEEIIFLLENATKNCTSYKIFNSPNGLLIEKSLKK